MVLTSLSGYIIAYFFTGAKAGDDIEITWKDLKGNSDTTVEKIK